MNRSIFKPILAGILIGALFFIMPSRVAAACIQSLYGVSGFVGIIATHSFLNMPFVFFIITVAYRSLDYTLYFAARDLGASAWREGGRAGWPVPAGGGPNKGPVSTAGSRRYRSQPRSNRAMPTK